MREIEMDTSVFQYKPVGKETSRMSIQTIIGRIDLEETKNGGVSVILGGGGVGGVVILPRAGNHIELRNR